MSVVDVVIVNWNAGDLLERCIESIFQSRTRGYEFGRVIVVDNASSDDSLSSVARRWPREVEIVRNQRNLGFGHACNEGAARGEGEWILFLNPDARLFQDTLTVAIEALESRASENASVCGVQLLNSLGQVSRSCARFPDTKMFAVAALGLTHLFPKRFESHVLTKWDHKNSAYVDHVIGAFYLIRRQLFRHLRGFDERFFVYMEDLDLSQRVHQAGGKVYFCAETHAFHEGGGTSKAIPAGRLFYAQRSRLQYARKHLSALGFVCIAALTLFVEPWVRLAAAIGKARLREAGNTIRAYVMLYADIIRRSRSHG